MKLTLIALAALVSSAPAYATEIIEGGFNSRTNKIELLVRYGGGCEEHKFKLEVGGCLESFPVQCEAVLKDVTPRPDPCEAMITQKVELSLKETGLDDDYYTGASIVIRGSNNSSVNIRLPR